MHLSDAKQVMLRTHMAALANGTRATAIELVSGPGIGKSSVVMQTMEALAREINEPVGIRVFMLATIQSCDVNGFGLPAKNQTVAGIPDFVFSLPPWYPVRMNTYVVTPDGVWHKPGQWPADMPMPRIGGLFLDEYAQADDDVKKPAAELLLNGRVGTCELPPGWRVIAASNRMSDRSGVLRPLMFAINRRMELRIDAHLPTWEDWCNAQPVEHRPHYLTLSFARKHPQLVFRDEIPTGTDPFCTPRTLIMMDANLRALRTAEETKRGVLPMDHIAREVCAGLIGPGECAQFMSHIKFADSLPDIEDVIKTPKTAKLPDGLDGQMVCAFFLAHQVDDKSCAPILEYIKRMKAEMQVLCVTTITKQQDRAKHLATQRMYTEWLLRNRDVLVASQS